MSSTGSADEKADSSIRSIRLEIRKILREVDKSMNQGDLEMTSSLLDSLLTIDPANPDGLYLRGKVSLIKGDSTAALELLNQAADKAPRSTRIKLLLARLHLKNGNWEETVALAESVLAIKPSHGEASYLLGWGLMLSGDTAQAVDIFEKVLAKELNGDQ